MNDVLGETQRLINIALDELEKTALVDRAHRELRKRGLCGPQEGANVHVQVVLDVKIEHGHPAQVMAVLREHLAGVAITDIEDGIVASVERVSKIDIH